MDGKNLKRNWIGYFWSSFAPAFSCSSRSSPAFRCPVSPSARLPPTKIQAKRAMSLKLVQLVCYRFTLSKLFVFKSFYTEKEQGVHMLCELNIDLVSPRRTKPI